MNTIFLDNILYIYLFIILGCMAATGGALVLVTQKIRLREIIMSICLFHTTFITWFVAIEEVLK